MINFEKLQLTDDDILEGNPNLVPRALFPGFGEAREKRPGDEVGGNPFGDIDPRPRFWSNIHESIVFKTLRSKRTCPFRLWLTNLPLDGISMYNLVFSCRCIHFKFSERALLQNSLYFPQSKISSYGLGMKAAKIGPDLMLSITLLFVSGKHTVLNFGHGQNAKFFFVLSLFSLLPLFLPSFFPLLDISRLHFCG